MVPEQGCFQEPAAKLQRRAPNQQTATTTLHDQQKSHPFVAVVVAVVVAAAPHLACGAGSEGGHGEAHESWGQPELCAEETAANALFHAVAERALGALRSKECCT